MTLVPSTASVTRSSLLVFSLSLIPKPLLPPLPRSLWPHLHLSLGKPGNIEAFPTVPLGWAGSQGQSDHLALPLHLWSSAQAPWWMRTPDLRATLRKANNILPSSQNFLHPSEVCCQCFDHSAACPLYSTCQGAVLLGTTPSRGLI